MTSLSSVLQNTVPTEEVVQMEEDLRLKSNEMESSYLTIKSCC